MRPITNWDRLDGLPEKITAEEFRAGYAERSRLTVEEFDRWFVVAPCECGEEGCEGWQAVQRETLRRLKREEREARGKT